MPIDARTIGVIIIISSILIGIGLLFFRKFILGVSIIVLGLIIGSIIALVSFPTGGGYCDRDQLCTDWKTEHLKSAVKKCVNNRLDADCTVECESPYVPDPASKSCVIPECSTSPGSTQSKYQCTQTDDQAKKTPPEWTVTLDGQTYSGPDAQTICSQPTLPTGWSHDSNPALPPMWPKPQMYLERICDRGRFTSATTFDNWNCPLGGTTDKLSNSCSIEKCDSTICPSTNISCNQTKPCPSCQNVPLKDNVTTCHVGCWKQADGSFAFDYAACIPDCGTSAFSNCTSVFDRNQNICKYPDQCLVHNQNKAFCQSGNVTQTYQSNASQPGLYCVCGTTPTYPQCVFNGTCPIKC